MSLPLYIPNPVFPLISKEYYKGTDGHRLKQILFSCHHPNVYVEKNPVTVRVPSNEKTKTILERLQGCQRTRTLVPCNSGSRYNAAIRKLLTSAGIICDVPVRIPKTYKEIIKPINGIAGSRMEKQVFTSNLYRQVKGPEPVAPMSGHAE